MEADDVQEREERQQVGKESGERKGVTGHERVWEEIGQENGGSQGVDENTEYRFWKGVQLWEYPWRETGSEEVTRIGRYAEEKKSTGI